MKIDTNRPQTEWVLLDCSAYQQLLGFEWAARKAGWPEQEVAVILQEAQRCDNDHLICTLAPYCQLGYGDVYDYAGPAPALRPDGLPDRQKTVHVIGDSNSFEELAGFQLAARRAGWTEKEIALVLEAAMSKSRAHLLATLAKYCQVAVGPAPGRLIL